MEAIEQITAAWTKVREHPALTDAYRIELQRHWQKVPLVQARVARR
jgi:hypothetical protein